MQKIVKPAKHTIAQPETDEEEDDDEESRENSADSSDENDEEATATSGNAGWADSMAKVLKTTKPKTKKNLVLSRAGKLRPGVEKKPLPGYDFEVEGTAGAAVKEKAIVEQAAIDDKVKVRKNLPLALRSKPTWQDIERERTLRKVATRGVVQLFNAVRIEQKDLQQQIAEAGPLDSRRDAVLNNINKRKFLDVLMGGKRAKSEAVDNPIKSEVKGEGAGSDSESSDDDEGGKKKSEWHVLRPDYMTNKKIKHWDEEEENSDGGDDSDEDENGSSGSDQEDE